MEEKCCFYCSLRTGAIIISIVGAFEATVQLVVYSLALRNDKNSFEHAFYGKLDELSTTSLHVIFGVYVFKVVLEVLAYVGLLVGAVMERPWLVLVYLVVISFFSVAMLLRTVAFFILGWSDHAIKTLALAFTNWVVAAYCVLAMHRLYLRLRAAQQPSVPA